MEQHFRFDAQLSTEEKLIRDSVQQWVKAEVQSKLMEAFSNAQFPKEFISQMANLGLFGMKLPAKYGGLEANNVAYGLVCQELEYGDSALRSFVSVQSSLVMYSIFQFGDEKQKTKWLKELAKGKLIGAFALTEADSGSDPASMKTTAKKTKDGWLLNGSKMWITNATIADIVIVWAKTNEGIRAFIVPTDSKGCTSSEIKNKWSLRMSVTGEFVFEDCFVKSENYLPGSNKGLAAALACLNQARYGIAWGSIGAAKACYDCALDYAKNRTQFKKPIASFQLIQKDLALMLQQIMLAKIFNLHVAHLEDKNQGHFSLISMAKSNAAASALEIARLARNILGANGISLEYPVIRHLANLETVYTYEGTDNIHKLVMAKEITGISAFV